MRVYEFAKQKDVSSKEILALLEKEGFSVASHMSVLSDDSISFLKIKRVDITYDGTNYYKGEPFDSATYREGLGDDDKTDTNFSKTAPQYDPKSFGFWLYPMASADDVTAGAKARMEFARAYTEYVYGDTTKEAPIDRPFHDLIAVGAALRNPGLPSDQYKKLQNIFGVKSMTSRGAIWSGGMGLMLAHYGSRNEDFAMDINPQLETYT